MSVICADGQEVIGHRITISGLTAGSALRVTLLGTEDFDPILVSVASGIVTCTDNTAGLDGALIAVPSGRGDGNAFAAQSVIAVQEDGTFDILAGGRPAQTGKFALLLENMSIIPEADRDTMRIQMPPAASSEVMGVYMIGSEGALNPSLAMFVTGEAEPLATCDNAGTRTCQNMPNLQQSGAQLPDETIYIGDDFDAGIMGNFPTQDILLELSASNDVGTGEYGVDYYGNCPR